MRQLNKPCLNEKEVEAIDNFLKENDIEYIEVYYELFDHIASAYQDRSNKGILVNEYLKTEVMQSFGGQSGLQKIVDCKKQVVRKQLNKEALRIFGSFFSSAKGALKSMIVLGLIMLALRFSNASEVFFNLSFICFVLPLLVVKAISLHFWLSSKKARMPFKKSLLNAKTTLICSLLVGLVQGIPDIAFRITVGERFNSLHYLGSFEDIRLPILFLFVLCAWTGTEICFKYGQLNAKMNHAAK